MIYSLTDPGLCEACIATGSTWGEKMAWISHLIGTHRAPGCLYGSTAAKSKARQQRQALEEKASKQDTNKSTQKHSHSASDSTSQAEGLKPKKLKQTPLKAYRNLDMPFSANNIAAIEAQTLHATISANLPFHAQEGSGDDFCE